MLFIKVYVFKKYKLEFLDEALISDGNVTRIIKIVKPFDEVIISEKIISASEKRINFDISAAPEGNYSIIVLEENGTMDSRVLIKVN